MKNVEFKNITVDNFCAYKEPKSLDLGRRTFITGANGAGKSTIKKAILYALGVKDESGKEISGIRPHDENGADIDGLTTMAQLMVSVDGAENTLKKTYRQKKNRQGEYTGESDTQYFIDDVKKGTKKAYDEFVSSFLPSAVCISAQELLIKDTAGRREMLSVFSKHDTDSIIDENPDFEPLRGKLKANSVADLKKACRDGIKAKTKERDDYPARIDEVKKQKVDIDLAELELHRNALNEQIAENKAKQADASKQFEEYDKLADGIMELKFELSDLQRKANEENNRKKAEIEDKITDIQIEIKKARNEVFVCENNIKTEENNLKYNQDGITQERENYKNASSIEFNPNELICPMCKREYGEERQKELRAGFDKNKAETLARITDNGNYFKIAIKQCKQRIEEHKKEKEECEDEIFELQKTLNLFVEERGKLPQGIDISEREDVKEINCQIAEKERVMKQGNSASEIRQRLQDEGEELQRQLNEVEKQFDKAENNNRIDERVAQLKKEQRDLSQKIADVERELDLLKRFEQKKAQLLEDDVNSNFELVQFHMFEKLVGSDDLKNVCQILVNGEPYDRNLNFSNKILAEIDICRCFQRYYGIVAPILADNIESIDPQRIPNIENQLILFRRSDDANLKIECLE